MDRIKKVSIHKDSSIKQAMKQLTESGMQILLVVDEHNRLIGTITDGDIRRALLKNMKLDSSLSKIVNRHPKFLDEEESAKAAQFMKSNSIFQVPIVNKEMRLKDVILWKDLNGSERLKKHKKKDNIVFILAGGQGVRLDPFTKILPKPLIPLNDKPIIEIVMENFQRYGFENFFLSLNYKAEMIRLYFKENPRHFRIAYIEEKKFLGTAGSLQLINKATTKPIIVSNCDVILNVCFDELLEYHEKNKHDFTMVGIPRNIKIPYGVVKMKNGALLDFIEKPEYDLIVNAGTYVIEPDLVSLIGKNEHMDMPDLLKRARGKYKIGVFPVSTEWFDIGQWEEYKEALEHFKEIEDRDV